VSKLTTARVSFRDQIVEKIEVGRLPTPNNSPDVIYKSMSFQYGEAADALGKTLHLFAGKQQWVLRAGSFTEADQFCRATAYQSGVRAADIANSAGRIDASLVAKVLYNKLASESQAIQVPDAEYHSVEFRRGDVDPIPQRLIFGYLLPSSYSSRPSSVDAVVGVFKELVSYVSEKRAWDWCIKRSDDTHTILDRHARARVSDTDYSPTGNNNNSLR
jgi:hypothetical protein